MQYEDHQLNKDKASMKGSTSSTQGSPSESYGSATNT